MNRTATPNPVLRLARGILILVCLLAVPFVATGAEPEAGYVPRDLDDAHRQLLKILPAAEMARIKAMKTEDGMIRYHMGLGMGLRNDWGLWSGSRLSRYFNRLGVHHPDDMSGIILDTFWCKLHEKPLRIEQRVALSQEYSRAMQKPKGRSPRDGARIAWLITISPGSAKGTTHLGISTSDHSYWRYVYGANRGIEPATAKDAKALDDMQKTWKMLGQKTEDFLRK